MRLIDCDNCIHNLVCNREQHLKEECIFFEQQHGKWIPCSERLPEKHGRYIVTNAYGCVREYDYNDWAVHDGKWLYCRHEILAWMPLPEPYEEGENNGQ